MHESPAISAVVAYGSMFGATERLAEDVADLLGAKVGYEVPRLDASWFDVDRLKEYDLLLIGACTWNVGQLPHGWETQLEDLAALDLRGKTVALFGTGDQFGYPDTFLDALGTLAAAVRAAGARVIGSWPTTGYEFTGSLAFEDGAFVGLALDDDNQPDETESRIAAWLDKVLREAGARDEVSGAPLAAVPG